MSQVNRGRYIAGPDDKNKFTVDQIKILKLILDSLFSCSLRPPKPQVCSRHQNDAYISLTIYGKWSLYLIQFHDGSNEMFCCQ